MGWSEFAFLPILEQRVLASLFPSSHTSPALNNLPTDGQRKAKQTILTRVHLSSCPPVLLTSITLHSLLYNKSRSNMYGRKPPRNAYEYVLGHRIPNTRVRPSSSLESPPLSLPPAPRPAPSKLHQHPKSACCSCCNHHPKTPKKKVQHVTDFDTSGDESSSDESTKVVRKELKSALKKPAKEEQPKKTVQEVCKTSTREARRCECVYCLKSLLDELKIDTQKGQDQKKHVSFDNRYCLPSFPYWRHTIHI